MTPMMKENQTIKMGITTKKGLNVNQKERLIIAGILIAITLMVGFDLATDSREGVVIWHLFAEGTIGIASLIGVFYVLRGSIHLKHQLEKEIYVFSEFRKEAEKWRAESRKYLAGLSQAIDQQLTKWNLTTAEKEVAFFLLKGLSLKDIAEV